MDIYIAADPQLLFKHCSAALKTLSCKLSAVFEKLTLPSGKTTVLWVMLWPNEKVEILPKGPLPEPGPSSWKANLDSEVGLVQV